MHGFPELRHLDLTGCEGIAPATAVRPRLALPCLSIPSIISPFTKHCQNISS
jgi:hypothetical protein